MPGAATALVKRSFRHQVLMRRGLIFALVSVSMLCGLLRAADEPKNATSSQSDSQAQAAPSTGSPAVQTASDTSPLESYQQINDAWTKQLEQIAQLEIQGAEPLIRSDLYQQWKAATISAREILPKLKAAAEKAYAADSSKREAADLLYAMTVDDLRNDNYEDALELCNFLIEHKYPDKKVYLVAASAAIPTMHLEEAKKYLQVAAAEFPKSAPDIQQSLAYIAAYEPIWAKEQKLREAEAKADDLPRVKLHTSQGDIVLELFENEAPNTVANFISLVEKGFYDGVQFHRVLPNFMAQTGDPLSKDPANNADKIGSGNPGYFIADECNQPNHRDHFRGSVSMAHSSAPDSNGSQFFINFVPTPHLDGKHTVFGRVIDGIDVLAKIQRIDPEKQRERKSDLQPDTIIKAEVLRKRDHPYEPKTLPLKTG